MYTQNIKLDMDTGAYDPIIVKQNDSGRKVIVSLTKDSKAFVIPFKSAKIFFKRMDNQIFFNTATFENNNVEFELTTEILKLAGTVKVEIAFYDGTEVVTSIIFKIVVLESIRNDTVVESINKNDAIAEILTELDLKTSKEYVDNL